MIRRPPRSTRTDTLVPYTTLFRSPGLLISVIVTPYPLELIHPPANAMRRTVSITAFEQAVHHVGDDQRPRLHRPPCRVIADRLGLPAGQLVAGLPERPHQIGRASSVESGCQYGKILVVAVSLTKNNTTN